MPTVLRVVPILLLASAPLPAQDAWPGFRGPQRDGVARDATPPLRWSATKNLAWSVELPGAGSSSPIVCGDRVYVTCYTGYGHHVEGGGDPKRLEHHLVCVERATGKLIFKRAIKGALESAAPRVQITEHGFATPTPITEDGSTIWVYFGRAGIVAFDADGEVRWQSDLGKPSADAPAATNAVERAGKRLPLRWGSAASPLLCDDLVIVNASEESNSIRAFDKNSGDLVWKRESSNLEGSAISPMLAGTGASRVLVIALGGEVWGLEPRTGKLLWSVETGTRGGMSPTPVADREHVYVFGGGGDAHALRFAPELAAGGEGDGAHEADGAGGAPPSRVIWKSENLDIPSPVLADARLYLVRTNGIGLCLDAKDGAVRFEGRLPGRTSSVYASPVVAAGRLYVTSRKRGTFVYSTDGKFELLATNQIEGDTSQFNASPALAGKQLFLRSDTHLYCIAEA